MTVHLFGAASSNYTLKATADDNEEEMGSAPAEFLRNDFYVDDGLKSIQTVGEAIDHIKGVRSQNNQVGTRRLLQKIIQSSEPQEGQL